MATKPANPSVSTTDAAANTATVPVNNAKKSEKPPKKPIYENFRYKTETNISSRLRRLGNNWLRRWKNDSDKGDEKNGANEDYSDEEPPDEKNVNSEAVKDVYGFDYEVLWLVRLLVKPGEEDFKRIGVVGMPDIGKSDIGRLIFKNESVKQHFAPRIWVPMSGKSTKDVVVHILKELDVEDDLINKWSKSGTGDDNIEADTEAEKKAVDALLYALNLKLVGKRYLIILDDVHEWSDKLNVENAQGGNAAPAAPPPAPAELVLVCDPFKFGFPKESGGAVVVTSRNKSLVKKMVPEKNVYTPQPIKNADSSWDIYNSVLERKIELPTEDLKQEFKKKSGGLPVAARLMGRIKNKIIRAEERKGIEAKTNGDNKTENGAGAD